MPFPWDASPGMAVRRFPRRGASVIRFCSFTTATRAVTGNADDATAVFDASLAEYPTRVLRCDEVVDLIPLSHAPDRIAQYRDEMRQGNRFPPISVIRLVGRYLVADGHKRFAAYR